MRNIKRTAAAVAFALLTLLSVNTQFTNDAAAQSSVRPPANATQNAVPGSGDPTAGRPTRQPTELRDGAVPGGSMGTNSDADIWRKIRDGVTGNVSIPDKRSGQMIRGTDNRLRTREDVIAATESRGGSAGNLGGNNAGIASWIELRNGPLVRYGLYAMGGIIALLQSSSCSEAASA